MSLSPIPYKTEPGAKGTKQYLRSFSDLYERLATEGLVTPSSIDVEQSVLGAMLIDKSTVNKVLEIIGQRTQENSPFYRDAHTVIYQAMQKLDADRTEIDLIMLTNQLRFDGKLELVGGPSYLVELTTRVVTTSNVETHARIILEKYLARELIRTCEEIKLRAFSGEEDTFELLDSAEGSIFKLSESRHKNVGDDVKDIALDVLKVFDAVDGRPGGVTGIISGLKDIDGLTAGWQNQDLIILAARPSQGKTALALEFAKNAAMSQEPTPVAFFSLEMSKLQLVQRLICSEAKIDSQRARKGQLTEQEWLRIPGAVGRISALPITIDDTPAITPMELRAKCRRLKMTKKIGLVIVDYLQLMALGGKVESREREISAISRSLKALAKELDLPVIALSQLNRSVESRADKRPMLSDLRESGAIEQDADLVMFIYRPETYGEETCEVRGSKIDSAGIAEVNIAKQRNGPVDAVWVTFIKEFARFENHTVWPTFHLKGQGNYTEPREQGAF